MREMYALQRELAWQSRTPGVAAQGGNIHGQERFNLSNVVRPWKFKVRGWINVQITVIMEIVPGEDYTMELSSSFIWMERAINFSSRRDVELSVDILSVEEIIQRGKTWNVLSFQDKGSFKSFQSIKQWNNTYRKKLLNNCKWNKLLFQSTWNIFEW